MTAPNGGKLARSRRTQYQRQTEIRRRGRSSYFSRSSPFADMLFFSFGVLTVRVRGTL
jgi:hypothetical protein